MFFFLLGFFVTLLVVIGIRAAYRAQMARICKRDGHDWEWDFGYRMRCRRCKYYCGGL